MRDISVHVNASASESWYRHRQWDSKLKSSFKSRSRNLATDARPVLLQGELCSSSAARQTSVALHDATATTTHRVDTQWLENGWAGVDSNGFDTLLVARGTRVRELGKDCKEFGDTPQRLF